MCILQFLELHQHFRYPHPGHVDQFITYFKNHWSNTKGIDARIDHLIKINNNQKKTFTLRTAFSFRESNTVKLLFKKKGVSLQNL